MDKKEEKKIPPALLKIAFEMVSFIDEMDRQKVNEEKTLKDLNNRSINNVEKNNKR
ncbi:hypothetical protein [Defluviitalea saccharophila]|uniref:Uncharacterized protein n=1 Tax=Defluviitalea saccharophila TaxID=879970 RepID=A0ABZ2Y0S2_9FIRM